MAGTAQITVTLSPAHAGGRGPHEPPGGHPCAGAHRPCVPCCTGGHALGDAVGHAPAHSTGCPTVFTWPVQGDILTDYSLEVLSYNPTMDDWRTHDGLDIASAAGTEVKAAAAGRSPPSSRTP